MPLVDREPLENTVSLGGSFTGCPGPSATPREGQAERNAPAGGRAEGAYAVGGKGVGALREQGESRCWGYCTGVEGSGELDGGGVESSVGTPGVQEPGEHPRERDILQATLDIAGSILQTTAHSLGEGPSPARRQADPTLQPLSPHGNLEHRESLGDSSQGTPHGLTDVCCLLSDQGTAPQPGPQDVGCPLALAFFQEHMQPLHVPLTHTDPGSAPEPVALEVVLSPMLCWVHGPIPQKSCPVKWSSPIYPNSLQLRFSLKSGSPSLLACWSHLPLLKC